MHFTPNFFTWFQIQPWYNEGKQIFSSHPQGFTGLSCITDRIGIRKGIPLHTKAKIAAAYQAHADTVYRVCYTCMKGHRMDTEDALQATFLALLRSGKRFESASHEKAWLIVTASNICKNMLKRSHRRDVPFDPELNSAKGMPEDETLQAVLGLPDPMRLCIYLHYYEGYTAREVAAMIHSKEATVWSYLHRGRGMLKAALKEDMR